MPLPSPKSNESRGDFIARCMANPTARSDFPDDKQRGAVCFRQWRERNKDHSMTDISFTDVVMLDGLRRTDDGYLVADARVARTGIQEYRGFEVGKPELERVRVYRPEEEVFARDAMRTYAHRPVTLDHPTEFIDADNWKKHAIGQTGDEVVRDGQTVRVPLVLMDADAIKAVEEGKRELSMGYAAELVWEDGETPDGEPYDAIQKTLRMNHLAVVARARGGSELKLGDDREGGPDMTDKHRTMTVDGLSVEMPETAHQVVDKALKERDQKIADADKTLADAKAASKEEIEAKDAEIAAKDTEIAKKDAEIDELKGQVMDQETLDARVQERVDLVAKARTIHKDLDPSGKTDADIRKEVVVAKLGTNAIDGKGEAYIDARFDLLVEEQSRAPGPLRDAIRQAVPKDGDARVAAYDGYRQRLANAWQGEQKEN